MRLSTVIGSILLGATLLAPISTFGWFRTDLPDRCFIEKPTRTEFVLTISRSFTTSTRFELCQNEDGYFLSTSFSTSEDPMTWIHRETQKLSESESESLLGLFVAALSYNAADDVSGLDGSSWCLDAYVPHPRFACFFSPVDSNDHETRGLTGLVKLGTYLWDFKQLESEHGRVF